MLTFLIEILIILTIHFIADFIFQAEEWANNKSKNFDALISHTFTYSMIWWVSGFIYIMFYLNTHEYKEINNVLYPRS